MRRQPCMWGPRRCAKILARGSAALPAVRRAMARSPPGGGPAPSPADACPRLETTAHNMSIYVAAIPPPPANLSFRWTPCCRWEPPSSNISTSPSTSTWIWSSTSRHKARRSHHLKWRVLLVHCSRNRRAEGAVGVETEAEMWR